MIDTIVQWLASLTSSPLGQFVLFYLVSGALALVLGRRSQIDAWAEQHPRLAAALKALRGLGLDPWLVLQSLSLAIRKRLPAQPVDKPKPPSEPPTHIHLTPLIVLSLLLVGCTPANEPPPCDPASYAALSAGCGDDAAECDRQISERETYCAKQIQGEP